jgi:Cof subfamily protein (haloacid dehalogenase superfamily)
MIRLIGLDVDGTLLDREGQLPAENARAIHEAVHAGIHVALVTGRSYPWARPVADTLPDAVTLIVSNGAVERGKDGATYVRRLLDRAVAREILGLTRPYRHAAAVIFDRDTAGQIMFETMDWGHPGRKAYWARNKGLIAQAASLEDTLTEDPIQVMFNGGVESMRQLAGALRAQEQPFAVSLTEYPDRDFSLIDVTAPQATKGQALAWRAAQLGLDRTQVMAIGDNYNDLEMLEFAGLPVVMANAVPELKERGWALTGDQDAAGVGAAIRKFALSARDCTPLPR